MMELTPELLEDAAALWKAMGFVNDRHGSIKHLAENLAIRDQAHAFAIAERDARIAELERQLKEETERGDRISSDWFEFCDYVGVRADTQEAVAYKIKADFSNLRHEKEAAEARVKELEERLTSVSVMKDEFQAAFCRVTRELEVAEALSKASLAIKAN